MSSDFEAVYGHPLFLAETFVDESRFKGTCYIASNWKHAIEIVYGATSLTPKQTPPQWLLELICEHWEMENRVHYIRDVTYDEDRCRILTQNGPPVMATIRTLAIHIAK